MVNQSVHPHHTLCIYCGNDPYMFLNDYPELNCCLLCAFCIPVDEFVMLHYADYVHRWNSVAVNFDKIYHTLGSPLLTFKEWSHENQRGNINLNLIKRQPVVRK